MTPASCPFCGETARIDFITSCCRHYVICYECNARGPMTTDSAKKAVELWNERPKKEEE